MSTPSIDQTRRLRDLPAFAHQAWQMSYGERSTIEGVLAMLNPSLAIEIGRAEGGSLRRIAAYSKEVISFDIVTAPAELAELPNVRALAGDSHVMLPAELRQLTEQGRNVDFVLVDGDHTSDGARRDMIDLLESDAIGQTVILAHDTLNEEVREGLEAVDYDAYAKVAWVDLDFIPGYVARLPARLGECWGGLGLIVVDSTGAFQAGGVTRGTDLFEQHRLVWPAARWIARTGPTAPERLDEVELTVAGESEVDVGEIQALTSELERHQAWLRGIEASASWRLTAPLRTLKRRLLERLQS